MIAIDKPYISDFLLQSIRKNSFPVIATKEARNMITDGKINWITEEEAIQRINADPDARVYTNSENSIGWMQTHATRSRLTSHIELFKNKIQFRELLANAFPDYQFMGIGVEELENLDSSNISFPLVIKPAVGFFSVGVHKVDHQEEWARTLDLIRSEVEVWKGVYPEAVINTTEFIIEECIEGEEYAIDCYFNQKGDPVVLNILHHLFSSGKDVSDRVYSTSQSIVEQHMEGVRDFLRMIGKKANLVNFPAHVEVRINPQGKIFPIEINPMRFGGWCTTADLSWFAYGFDSYAYFFNSGTPNWEDIFENRKGKIYSVIVLDNNSGLKAEEIESFDYDRLKKDFEKPLEVRRVDFRTYGVFGFLFTETSEGNEEELRKILTSDLKQYIHLK